MPALSIIAAAVVLWLTTPLAQTGQNTASSLRAVVLVDSAKDCQLDPDVVRIEMKIHLRLENVGIKPLIVPRWWTQDGWRDAPDEHRLAARKWGSLDWSPAGTPGCPDIGKNRHSSFGQGDERMNFPMDAIALLVRPDSASSVAIQLFLEPDVSEDWTDEDIHKAEDKWLRSGWLWFKTIKTEPFTVNVATNGKRTVCPERRK